MIKNPKEELSKLWEGFRGLTEPEIKLGDDLRASQGRELDQSLKDRLDEHAQNIAKWKVSARQAFIDLGLDTTELDTAKTAQTINEAIGKALNKIKDSRLANPNKP